MKNRSSSGIGNCLPELRGVKPGGVSLPDCFPEADFDLYPRRSL